MEFFHFVWQKKLQRILLNAARNSLKTTTFDILGWQFSFSRNFLCLGHFGDQLEAVHKSFLWRIQTHGIAWYCMDIAAVVRKVKVVNGDRWDLKKWGCCWVSSRSGWLLELMTELKTKRIPDILTNLEVYFITCYN